MDKEYKKIANEINKMHEEDQRYRQALEVDWQKQHEIDARNLIRMKEIVNMYGCITISKFDKETSYNAWEIIQHSINDIPFMEAYLKLMEENINDIKKSNYAYLKDRVLHNLAKPQIYGTQLFKTSNDKSYYYPEIEDVKNVDKRRAEFGMVPLS